MEQGATIGGLATEGRDSLVARMRLATPFTAEDQHPHDHLLNDLMGLVDPIDKVGFERKLNGAVAVIPFEEAVQLIVLPLQRRIGELWHQGRLGIAIEHYVTKLIQQKLCSVMNQLPVNELGPLVLIACPEGEFHEIGAQTVAYLAAARGCHIYYLGPNLPISDLESFCERVNPDMILLSLTKGKSEAAARRLLRELKPLSTRWPVVVGGQGANAIAHLIQDSGVEILEDLPALLSRLSLLLSTRLLAAQR